MPRSFGRRRSPQAPEGAASQRTASRKRRLEDLGLIRGLGLLLANRRPRGISDCPPGLEVGNAALACLKRPVGRHVNGGWIGSVLRAFPV